MVSGTITRAFACALGSTWAIALPLTASAQEVTDLSPVEVAGVTPTQGAQLPENLMPYSVQSADAADFDRAQSLDITDYMARNLAGVTVNAAQGNPLQPDLQFRGFTATPLLGGSQGVSVYVDGVRVNEVFGDTVNWDLIPQDSIARLSLVAGANPVFGLNTLGGALDITTKDGFTDPGTSAQFMAGSFGRTEATVQSGGNDGRWGYYALATRFDEDGWRDLSDSNATNLMGTLSWRGDAATFDLHLAHGESSLTGNGTVPVEELALRRASVFTAPDRTRNTFSGITANGTYALNDDTSLAATVFARQVDTQAYNGDDSIFDACEDDDDILCDDHGDRVIDQDGETVTSEFDAINNIGMREQRSHGVTLQAVFRQPISGLANQLVVGVDYDNGRLDYSSVLEMAVLEPDPSGSPYSRVTSENSGVFIPDKALKTEVSDVNAGVYFTDTLSLTDRWAVTASGRYNLTRTEISDLTGVHPDLDGNHRFHRFNPALGTTFQWSPALNFYGGYSESTRAPTPVELTCASPDAPCLLPNDFVSDPPLDQVVARSWEAGLRGKLANGKNILRWDVGLYRTTNSPDILFQSTGGAQSNEGYFANVGDTRRQGVQAALAGKLLDGRLDWYANYTYLDATFRSTFEETSANNPAADPETGLIEVSSGNRIPSLPEHAFKLGVDVAVTPAFSLGADMIANSGQYLRGDEANAVAQVPGYAVFNLHASYQVNTHLNLSAHVNNLFDRDYANFGTLGDPTDLFPDFTDPRFFSPGAPRGAWMTVTYAF